jgi:predicted transcriptional regulator
MDTRFLPAYGVPVRSLGAPVLGELELAVLDHVWRVGRCEPKGVHAVLGKERGITLSTIQSTLKRLYEKGVLEREKVSHAHVYTARLGRAEFHRMLVGALVGDLLRGDADAVVSAFVDLAERAGDDHLAKLEGLVAARRAQRKGRR